MYKLSQFVVDFLKAEDGPTAVEYAVMLALIIVVCIGAITTLGGNANKTFTSVGTSIGGSKHQLSVRCGLFSQKAASLERGARPFSSHYLNSHYSFAHVLQ